MPREELALKRHANANYKEPIKIQPTSSFVPAFLLGGGSLLLNGGSLTLTGNIVYLLQDLASGGSSSNFLQFNGTDSLLFGSISGSRLLNFALPNGGNVVLTQDNSSFSGGFHVAGTTAMDGTFLGALSPFHANTLGSGNLTLHESNLDLFAGHTFNNNIDLSGNGGGIRMRNGDVGTVTGVISGTNLLTDEGTVNLYGANTYLSEVGESAL